jgi:site-specific DNA recombinase
MGGTPPLGYDPLNRKLEINENEAKIIQIIYQRFSELKSITETTRELNELGYKTKTWISKSGRSYQGMAFSKKAIRHILQNPVYAGKIIHKKNVYDGQHTPIIDPETWRKIQNIFTNKASDIAKEMTRISQPPLLKGIFNCGYCNTSMTPKYSMKKNGSKYRYYTCSSKLRLVNEGCIIGTISATEVESAVTEQVLKLLEKPEFVVHAIAAASMTDGLQDNQVIQALKNIHKIWQELFLAEQLRITHLFITKVIITLQVIEILIYNDDDNSQEFYTQKSETGNIKACK